MVWMKRVPLIRFAFSTLAMSIVVRMAEEAVAAYGIRWAAMICMNFFFP